EESPQHSVALPAYAIARTPVTCALYAAFVAATGARPPLRWRGAAPPPELLNHPVTDATWHDARPLCAWLTAELPEADRRRLAGDLAGGPPSFRLPTEAEWERAARGTDGRRFPWGDAWDPSLANTRESGLASTAPVGSYPAGASPSGCLDMAGNVWEWTSSLVALYPYDPAGGREAPSAPGRRILRGGCYANPHGYARCACRFRMPPEMRNEFLGFRLALS